MARQLTNQTELREESHLRNERREHIVMAKVQQCSRCLMDITDPDISFDDAGVCCHCHKFDTHFAARITRASNGDLIPSLMETLAKVRDSPGKTGHDSLVGISGGVDSTYLLKKCVEWGLRPLAIHIDNGWNSSASVSNMKQATERLGVDLVHVPVADDIMKALQAAFLRAGVKNCEMLTDHAFPSILLSVASSLGIRSVINGGNLVSESVLPRSWGHNSADYRYLKSVVKRYAPACTDLKSFPHTRLAQRYVWYPFFRHIKSIRPLDSYPYNTDDAKQTLEKEMAWTSYGSKHQESIFTRFFQGVYLPTKFGIDKRRAHCSSLILAGQLTREQGAKILQQPPYPQADQQADIRRVAEHLGFADAELREILVSPPREEKFSSSLFILDSVAPRLRRLRSWNDGN